MRTGICHILSLVFILFGELFKSLCFELYKKINSEMKFKILSQVLKLDQVYYKRLIVRLNSEKFKNFSFELKAGALLMPLHNQNFGHC